MFDNIGEKIKILAKVVCWIGIVISVICGFMLIVQDEDTIFAGLLTMGIGSLISWVGSSMAYGFGQLIVNSNTLVEFSKKMTMTIKNPSLSTATFITDQTEVKHTWRCPKCGNMISQNVCPHCSNEVKQNPDIQDTNTHCPHCDRKIIIPEGTLNAICPWCNKKISL